MTQKLSRYPGARPFETAQQHIFYGRKRDTDSFFNLLQVEQLVVMYGKSGTGKSSLLNAGVIPEVLKDGHYEPLRVRFTAWNPKEAQEGQMPIVTTRQVVRKGSKPVNTFLDKLIKDENTLWHDIKEHQIQCNSEKGVLLLFDQFEELFSYPAAAILEFRRQLAEALYTSIPQRYWKVMEANYKDGKRLLTKDETALLQESPRLKVVFAVRSDRLHLLNQLSDHLPTVLKQCYELRALDEKQAAHAVVQPALATGDFECPPFAYDDAALASIVSFLTQDGGTSIESTQMQIVCHSIEEKVLRKGLKIVTPEAVGDLESIIRNYYDERIAGLPDAEQLPARRLIEDNLIFEEERRRLSMYEGQMLKYITPESLRKLVDSHLLRAEPSMQGGYTYELCHDTLVAPVLKAKAKRKEKERLEAEEQARWEREKELALERKRSRGARILAILFFILAVAAYSAFDYAKHQKKLAEKRARSSYNAALVFQKENADPTLALRIAGYNLQNNPDDPVAITAFRDIASNLSNRYYRLSVGGYEKPAGVVAFSPNGQTIFTGGGSMGQEPNSGRLWDMSGNELATFSGHGKAIVAVAFSPDGGKVLSGSNDGTAKLWDLNGRELTTFSGHNNRVTSVAFSPDGRKILTGCDDKVARLFRENGELLLTITGHTKGVSVVAFSPDGQLLLTAGKDGLVKLWNTAGTLAGSFVASPGAVLSAAFSPDGRKILTGGTDYTAVLWDLSGNESATFTGHSSWFVNSVAFSPGGTRVLSGSSDKTARLWDVSGNLLATFAGHAQDVQSVAFSSDGKMIATAGDDMTAKVWDVAAVEMAVLAEPSGSAFNAVAFSPDGQYIATGGSSNAAVLWEVARIKTAFSGHTDIVTDLAFSSDGQSLLSGSEDGTAILWNLKGEKIVTLAGNMERVYAVAISPDGQTLLTGSNVGTAVLWNRKGEVLATCSGHTDEVRTVAFSPGGQTLLTGSRDKTLKLWNLKGKELLTFSDHVGEIYAAAFSSDGTAVLSGDDAGEAKLWSIGGEELVSFESPGGGRINAVAFSPDSDYLLTAHGGFSTRGEDNTVHIWDGGGGLLFTFSGHREPVSDVAVSPDGSTVVSVSLDGTARLWLTSQALLRQKLHNFSLEDFEFYGVELETGK
jgi:WD40 repeat protein